MKKVLLPQRFLGYISCYRILIMTVVLINWMDMSMNLIFAIVVRDQKRCYFSDSL